jgi:Flp pilus assembly protein TadD
MKKTRINLIATVALAIVFASCSGLDKMNKKAEEVNYTVTPEVLEEHGGKVDVTVKVQIPEKYFDKKVSLEATPVLVYDGGETAFEPYTLQGESVDGNAKVISYTNGGSFTYTGSVPYNDNMRVSDLVVKVKASKGDKTLEFDPYKIADGVDATPTLVADMAAKPVIGADHFQRIIPEEKAAQIFFIIQRANLRGSELTKDEVKQLNEYIKEVKATENKEFKGVNISAYASPDGPMDLNTDLAAAREKNTQKYLTKQLKKAKVDEAKSEEFFNIKSTPEDWEGFKELMEKSNIQDKDLILRVLAMYSDPEVREREIKNMSATFKVLAEEILPKLRRSKLAVNVDVIGKSDEEISNLAANNPSELNIEELLYAATLTDNKDDQLAIYKAAANKYPQCWRAENNVGVVLYEKGDLAGAKAAFEKANSLKSGVPEINNNLGVIALREGDIAKAEEYFGNAAGAGPALDNNLGIVAIHKGDYDAAVRYFGNAANCNAALAKILVKNYDAALSTLNAIPHEAGLKYYLKAVVGAKTSDSDMMFASLRKAVELDSKFKKLAATDVVFGKYLEDATFKSIVE